MLLSGVRRCYLQLTHLASSTAVAAPSLLSSRGVASTSAVRVTMLAHTTSNVHPRAECAHGGYVVPVLLSSRPHCLRHRRATLSSSSWLAERLVGVTTGMAYSEGRSFTTSPQRPAATEQFHTITEADAAEALANPNKVYLTGFVADNVEVGSNVSGSLATFRLGVALRNLGIDWYRVEVRDRPEIDVDAVARFIKKGCRVHVQGGIRLDTHTDPASNHKTTTPVVEAVLIFFVEKPSTQPSSPRLAGGVVPPPMQQYRQQAGTAAPPQAGYNARAPQYAQAASAAPLSPSSAHGTPPGGPAASGQRTAFVKLSPSDIARRWDELLERPHEWYDNRNNKLNPRAPDFKHKGDGTGLWVDSRTTPPYVLDRLSQAFNQ